jgi:hypothetical protein
MVFNMYATTEKEYEWIIQSDVKEEIIGTQQIQLTQLNYVLSLISSSSFFIPPPSTISR